MSYFCLCLYCACPLCQEKVIRFDHKETVCTASSVAEIGRTFLAERVWPNFFGRALLVKRFWPNVLAKTFWLTFGFKFRHSIQVDECNDFTPYMTSRAFATCPHRSTIYI